MIHLKSPEELEIMARGGKISGQVLKETLDLIKPGISTLELDAFAENRIRELSGKPAFKGYRDYKFATCININDGIVHGIPGSYCIAQGDLVSIDLGVIHGGFNTDVSWTAIAGSSSKESKRFLEAGERALQKAISNCKIGNRIGDISYAIQTEIEKSGYNVVRDLVGHGVGQNLHEEPQIPCYGRPSMGIELRQGMTLAIEVIYTLGSPKLRVLGDGWTMATKDGTISGLFEQTVAIEQNGPKLLTAG